MSSSIALRLTAFVVALFMIFGVALTPVLANEGDHHDQVESSDPKIVQMMELIDLLTQLVALLETQAELKHGSEGSDHHETDSSSEESDMDELAVWIELHSNQTHAHVKEPGMAEDSFILESIHYTDEDEVIAAIAMKTGLSEHDIEEVIVFPSGEVNEHGDTTHEDNSDDDLAGIHIMSDGTVMLGSGEEVHDATITADGMIMLSDGTLVEPKFDLR